MKRDRSADLARRCRKLGTGLMLTTALLFSAPALAQTYEGVSDLPEIKLTVTDYNIPNSPAGRSVQAFADYAEEHSGGKIKMEIFWSSSLLGAAENAEGIASGVADLGIVTPLYSPSDFPISNWLTNMASQFRGGIPYGYAVVYGAWWEFVANNKELQKEFHDKGLELIGAQATPAFDMMCRHPVTDLESASGLRTRAAGRIFSREVEALGMVAVPMVPTEIYEALNRGVIDCVISQPSAYQDFGLVDIPGDKYYINSEFSGWNSTFYMINKAKFDGMPAVAQQILKDGFAVQSEVMMEEYIKNHKSFSEFLERDDWEALDPAENFHEKLRQFQDGEVAAMVDTAPETVSDPQGMIDKYFAYEKKWKNIVSNDLGIEEAEPDVTSRIEAWQKPIDLEPFVKRALQEVNASN